MSGHCVIDASLKRFQTEMGISFLKNHTKTHKQDPAENDHMQVAKASLVQKRAVIDAAAYAVAGGLLLLGFGYQKKGMVRFAKALVQIGQSIPVTATSDVVDLLPTPKAVSDSVKRIASTEQEYFRAEEFSAVINLGGGVTSDWLKQNTKGKKFYDFNLHYFQLT